MTILRRRPHKGVSGAASWQPHLQGAGKTSPNRQQPGGPEGTYPVNTEDENRPALIPEAVLSDEKLIRLR